MKWLIGTLLVASVAIAGPAIAQDTKTAGQRLAEDIFASIDESGKGYIHLGDMERFRSGVFAGMDHDGDLKVTYGEFAAWDPGFAWIAGEEGSPDAFATATKIIFSFWDRNADFVLTEAEMRFAVNADFRRADIDDDAVLTQAEFLQSFGIIVAMRAAIRPDIEYRVQ